jgi:hypothetical protein
VHLATTFVPSPYVQRMKRWKSKNPGSASEGEGYCSRTLIHQGSNREDVQERMQQL